MELFDDKPLRVDLSRDHRLEIGAWRQRPEAEHFQELPVQLGTLPQPIFFRFDVAQAGIGEALGFPPKIRVEKLFTALGLGLRVSREQQTRA